MNLLDKQRDASQSALAYELGAMMNLPPIAATAVCEHVFQELISQFYLAGTCYLPNFGWLHFVDGEVIFTPSDAMRSTLSRLSAAIDSREFSFAGIETIFKETESGT